MWGNNAHVDVGVHLQSTPRPRVHEFPSSGKKASSPVRGLCSQEPPAPPQPGPGRVPLAPVWTPCMRLPTRLSSHGSPTLHSSEQLPVRVLSQMSCKALADPGRCSSDREPLDFKAMESSYFPWCYQPPGKYFPFKQEKEKRRKHRGKSRAFPWTVRLGPAELPKPLPPDGPLITISLDSPEARVIDAAGPLR